MKILIFATHPIQYQAPIYRKLSELYDIKVYFLMNQTAKGQGKAGFGVDFEWDVPLTEGYNFEFLTNISNKATTGSYTGIVIDEKELKKVLEVDRPSLVIVNGWFPKGLRQVASFFKRKGITTVCRGDSNLSMTSNHLKNLLKEVYIRWIVRKFDYFLYVGEASRQFYLHYGIDKFRLFPAVHSINTPFFEEEYQSITPVKNKDGKIILGFVGKLINKKEPLLLLDAINKSKWKDSIILKVVGDGPLKQSLLDKALELNIELDFVGFLNQSEIVKKGYANLNALILPSSINETWGLVVNEVMTGGIPVLGSNRVGCHEDLVIDGVTGYIFESGNFENFVEKLNQLIEKLKSGYDFSENVFKQINKYSIDQTIKGYSALIKHIEKNKK